MTSLIMLMAGGFIGIGVIGIVVLLLVSYLGAWAMLVPVIALAALYGTVILKRRQNAGDDSPAASD